MKNLLRTEWLKIKNYNAFKVLMICFGAGILLSNYILYKVISSMIADNHNPTVMALAGSFDPYNFNSTWGTTSYASGFTLIIPSMLMILLVTNEYTYRTNRQNIIDGWNRKEFISTKLMLAFLLALFSLAVVFIAAMVMGFISGSAFSMAHIAPLGFFFLKALTYNLFAVLISVLVKRTGFAIGLFFIYLGGENFLSLYLLYLSKKLAMSGTDLGDLGSYLPLNASDSLVAFPDNPLKSIAKSIGPSDYMWISFAFAAAYILLFIWWSRRRYLKADL